MASKILGIAMLNFTAAPAMPDAKALIDYGVRMEQLELIAAEILPKFG